MRRAMFPTVPRAPVSDPSLAAAVRHLRSEKGWTQETVAFRAGITTGSVARIELEQAVPSWDTVRRLAAALDVTLVEFATEVEKQA